MVIASDQLLPEDMIRAAGEAVTSDVIHQDARCAAGMNVLHYVVLQPVLLVQKGQNTMKKLLQLMVKTGANMNAQVIR
jgi:hypothetical protein